MMKIPDSLKNCFNHAITHFQFLWSSAFCHIIEKLKCKTLQIFTSIQVEIEKYLEDNSDHQFAHYLPPCPLPISMGRGQVLHRFIGHASCSGTPHFPFIESRLVSLVHICGLTGGEIWVRVALHYL